MNWWKRRQGPVDERVEALKNKVYKEAYGLVVTICSVSLLYKSFVLDVGLEASMIEIVVLIVSGLYFMVRSVGLGIVADEAEMYDRRRKWSPHRSAAVIGLIGGFTLALVFGVRSAVLYGDETTRLPYFFSVFVVSLVMYVPFLAIASMLGTQAARKASESASKRNRE